MFQIKSYDSIVASMINNITAMTNKLTDFNTGSSLRTVLESVASEIDQYYQSLLKGLYEAVPVAVYKTFSFEKAVAVPASGYVTFTRAAGGSGAVTIPSGTRVAVPNAEYFYTVDDDTILAEGEDTVDVLVAATINGASTNCLAGTITVMEDDIDGIASVTNASGFINGADAETESERKLRFQSWLNTLARSTKDSILYGASNVELTNASGVVTERVVKALVHEPCTDEDPAGDPGYIEVYIWNGVDGASAELLAQVKKVLFGYTATDGTQIPGWKAAGCIAIIYAVALDEVAVTAAVTLSSTAVESTAEAAIEAAIDAYFQSLEIGESVIWAKLIDIIMGVSGVTDVSLTAPEANVDVTDWNYICSKGTVTLTFS